MGFGASLLGANKSKSERRVIRKKALPGLSYLMPMSAIYHR